MAKAMGGTIRRVFARIWEERDRRVGSEYFFMSIT